MHIKKTHLFLAAGLVLVAAVGLGGIYYVKHSKKHGASNLVYVNAVSRINNPGSDSGHLNRFAGVVETQNQTDITPDPERTIKEIAVTEGQTITAGTVLFRYDTSQDAEKLSKLKIDLERTDNLIQSKKSEISQLEKEKKNAPGDSQLDYTLQIQSAQMELKQTQYDRKAKTIEIDTLEKSLKNAEVKSEIDGVVKHINKNNEDSSSPFMSILSMGSFRVKGKMNEQNIGSFNNGQKVLVHSRVDDKVWTGTVGEIDTQKPDTKNPMEEGSSSDLQSTSYPFYVNLDSTDGLMLGQHVYIEPDFGQLEAKEGLWLDEAFIVTDKDQSYVWAADGKGRLTKKVIELGEHDEELFRYEIVKGLTEDDEIAFPEAGFKIGLKTKSMTMEE